MPHFALLALDSCRITRAIPLLVANLRSTSVYVVSLVPSLKFPVGYCVELELEPKV